ncbi:sugar ABC transporter substrate-binding protein [Clostridium thermarum]|uniref:sugar ABC transporter substrate-binding protein n=1 Tax=Clostridium thermarum TaxID=1716543 RepID=UPI001FADC8C7|nr:substrate-binding domain-containing protein [Clostridium thermarum]
MIKDKMIKNSIIAMLFLILAILVSFIIRDLSIPSSTLADNNLANNGTKKRIKIGFSLGTLKEERWIRDRDILMAKAQELGAEIIVQNANNDDQDQLKQVKYLLDQNIDVLIFVPNDHYKSADAVELAKREGVPVISYDRLVLNANVDLYISFDNVKVGKLMASAILDNMKSGNLLIVNGAKTDNNTSMIKEGYDEMLTPYIESGEIKILAEEWAPNWLKEYAFKVVDSALQENVKINAIIAGNDSLAEGVIEALSEHRLTGKVTVIGMDADLWACQRIVEGTQYMTIYKPIEKLAEATIEMAIRLVENKPLNIVQTINNGAYDIPYYVLEPIAVNKENMDSTIIRDGFHQKHEVYRN